MNRRRFLKKVTQLAVGAAVAPLAVQQVVKPTVIISGYFKMAAVGPQGGYWIPAQYTPQLLKLMKEQS